VLALNMNRLVRILWGALCFENAERLVHAYADGASRGNPGPAGCGAFVTTPEGRLLGEARRALGDATSNAAEYAAAALALELALTHRATAMTLHLDSRLVVEQLTHALGLGVGSSPPRALGKRTRAPILAAADEAGVGTMDTTVFWCAGQGARRQRPVESG
jgi:ribonuclease HI